MVVWDKLIISLDILLSQNRGSYMSAHELLNLLNNFGKRDKI